MAVANISDTETHLLKAVRDKIRDTLNYRDSECNIEYDEMAPTATGQVYVVVSPHGITRGPTHNSAQQMYDLFFSVQITVLMRNQNRPRDRQRDLYLTIASSLNSRIGQIENLIDFQMLPVIKYANDLIADSGDTTQGFCEPLKWAGVDPKPRIVGSEAFAGVGGDAALARSVYFDGAHREWQRTVVTS